MQDTKKNNVYLLHQLVTTYMLRVPGSILGVLYNNDNVVQALSPSRITHVIPRTLYSGMYNMHVYTFPVFMRITLR